MFRNSPGGLIREIISESRYHQFKQDATLYSDGDACPGIGLFLSGEIRVFKIGDGGREITLYEVFPGETCILNASCILAQRQYPANAVALTDGVLLFIPEGVFLRLVAEYEDMRGFIFALFSQRFTSIMELIDEVAFGRMDKRLIDYLIEKGENDIIDRTHQQIANDLGTSREVVSRLLKDFERKGKVVLSRHMIHLKKL